MGRHPGAPLFTTCEISLSILMSCWHLNNFWESALCMCQSGMAYHSAFSCKSKVIELCIINFTTTSQFTWELFSLFGLFTSQKVKKWKKISRIFSKLHTNHWWIVGCKDPPGILFWKKDAVMFDLLLWYSFFTFFSLAQAQKSKLWNYQCEKKGKNM